MSDLQFKLGYSGDIKKVINQVAQFYKIGKISRFKYLDEGYEDYNVKIVSDNGSYILKLFANNQLGDPSKTRRGKDVVERLVDLLLAAENCSLNSPRLLRGHNSEVIFRGEENMVGILYHWLEGETFYNLNATPTREELESVVSQIAQFNKANLHPVYYHDIWAVIHIHEFYNKIKKCLSTTDKALVNKAITLYDKTPLKDLPQCLVHGDLTKGNVLRSSSGVPKIIDFSVSNWTYRIIEIGLISSNLMFDPDNVESLRKRGETVCRLYQKFNHLEEVETAFVYNVAVASTAMELLGGRWRQEFFKDDSSETKYWLNLGRKSLEDNL
jgi:Ser/Thr protein kinase RdoA (MazF antagonist)